MKNPMKSGECKIKLADCADLIHEEIFRWMSDRITKDDLPHYYNPDNWKRAGKETTKGKTSRWFQCGKRGKEITGHVWTDHAGYSVRITPGKMNT